MDLRRSFKVLAVCAWLTSFLVFEAGNGPQDDFRAAPRVVPFFEVNATCACTGVSAIRHQGQVTLGPGVRISPGGWITTAAGCSPAPDATA